MTLDDILAEMELECVRAFPGNTNSKVEWSLYRGMDAMRVFARTRIKQWQKETEEEARRVLNGGETVPSPSGT